MKIIKFWFCYLNSNFDNITYKQLSNGSIDFTQYKYLDIVFQDLAINNTSFVKRYFVWNEGTYYQDGYVAYANNSIYQVLYSIVFADNTVSTSNAYYNSLVDNDILSCYAPYITDIYGHK